MYIQRSFFLQTRAVCFDLTPPPQRLTPFWLDSCRHFKRKWYILVDFQKEFSDRGSGDKKANQLQAEIELSVLECPAVSFQEHWDQSLTSFHIIYLFCFFESATWLLHMTSDLFMVQAL